MPDMTSRELVLKTLEYGSPERVPRHLWFLPWAEYKYGQELSRLRARFPDDIITACGFHREQAKVEGKAYEIGRYVDEWGCIFENRQRGIVGEVKEPLVGSWDDLEKLRLPRETLSIDREKINEFCRDSDKFVMGGCCARPFERLQFIRGTENVMLDLGLGRDEILTLIEKIHQFYVEEFEVWARTEVDGLMFMDDWGSQRSLLISPVMWRDIFRPLYKDYIEIAHQHGKKVFMHSDGYIDDIIPDLIELGLDALNSQIFCMDIEELGWRFKGKLTFWGEIDRQNLLAHGTVEDVSKAVKRVYRSLYHDGGVIAQLEFGPGAKPENVYQAFETWDLLSGGSD